MSGPTKDSKTEMKDLKPSASEAGKDAANVKGGRMRANPTEQGDVTQDGTSGGDQG